MQRNIRKGWAVALAGVAAGVIAAGTLALIHNDDGAASPATVAVAPTSTTSSPLPSPSPSPSPTTSVINRTITVSGQGTISVKPDLATVELGARAEASSAVDALSTTNQKVDAVIKAVKAAGVSDDDITTSQLYVNASYDRDGKPNGFSASNTVRVRVRGVDKAGPVIDAAASAAGENISLNGISFSMADPESVLADARTAAINNASKRAGEFAAAAGVKVGAVLQISEVSVSVPTPMYEMAADRTAAGASTPVVAGAQDMTVNVTVVYELTA
ncbi:MAG TPA: SIMPL domain-containing protein [Ilumatobacteraceae bacterium]|nr:SIMPL domain-containing protein [Ilumatobacteraceae bacterium]